VTEQERSRAAELSAALLGLGETDVCRLVAWALEVKMNEKSEPRKTTAIKALLREGMRRRDNWEVSLEAILNRLDADIILPTDA